MSEYIIKGTSLTNIADGIRSVDGSSGVLTPAQMAARLNTVKSSIDSALSALAGNGVEVPSGSTVHTLAELIAGAGSGSASGFAKVATGTITLSSDLSSITIEHGLGQMPDFAIAYNQTGYDSNLDGSSSHAYILSSILSDSGKLFNMAYMNKTNSVAKTFGAQSKSYTKADYLNETNAVFEATSYFSGSKESTYFEGYKTYRWIAGVYA